MNTIALKFTLKNKLFYVVFSFFIVDSKLVGDYNNSARNNMLRQHDKEGDSSEDKKGNHYTYCRGYGTLTRIHQPGTQQSGRHQR